MNFVQLWLDLHNFTFLLSLAEKELRDIFGDITYLYYFSVFLNNLMKTVHEKKKRFHPIVALSNNFCFCRWRKSCEIYVVTSSKSSIST